LTIYPRAQSATAIDNPDLALVHDKGQVMSGDLHRLNVRKHQIVVGKRISIPPANTKRELSNVKGSCRQSRGSLRGCSFQCDRDLSRRRDNCQWLPHDDSVLRAGILELHNHGTGLTQTLKENFQEFQRHFWSCLKAFEEVVSVKLTHYCFGDSSYAGTAWLLVNHAHFAEDLSDVKVSQVHTSPIEFFAYLGPPLSNQVGCLAKILLSNNDFSSVVPPQSDHTFLLTSSTPPCSLGGRPERQRASR